MYYLLNLITFSYLLLLNLNPRGHYISACSVYAAVQAQNKIKYKIHKTNKKKIPIVLLRCAFSFLVFIMPSPFFRSTRRSRFKVGGM